MIFQWPVQIVKLYPLACSIPTEIRTTSFVIPNASQASGGSDRCEVVNGCETVVSTPAKVGAILTQPSERKKVIDINRFRKLDCYHCTKTIFLLFKWVIYFFTQKDYVTMLLLISWHCWIVPSFSMLMFLNHGMSAMLQMD